MDGERVGAISSCSLAAGDLVPRINAAIVISGAGLMCSKQQ